MSNITYEIIPFSFLFVVIIFFLALKKNKKPSKRKKNNPMDKSLLNFKEFLETSELKLKALRDLYKQDLIDSKIYVKKTEKIANLITKEIGKDVFEIAQNKKNDIYNQVKVDILKKIDSKKSDESVSNLDSLILAVDKRIESGLENGKK